MMTADETLPWLDLRDVARVLGEERERARQIRAGVPEGRVDVTGAAPLADMTVRTYAYRQRHPGERRQYLAMKAEGREFPAPVYANGGAVPRSGDVPLWPILPGETREQVKDRFRVWYRNRTGPGAGGGRKPKVADELRREVAGSGASESVTIAQLRREVAAGATPQSVLDAAIRRAEQEGRDDD